jgi:hypothetical protein
VFSLVFLPFARLGLERAAANLKLKAQEDKAENMKTAKSGMLEKCQASQANGNKWLRRAVFIVGGEFGYFDVPSNMPDPNVLPAGARPRLCKGLIKIAQLKFGPVDTPCSRPHVFFLENHQKRIRETALSPAELVQHAAQA